MRKISMLSLTILFLVFSVQIVSAAPCYGPNMPNKGKWEVGAQTNILLKREMEKTYGRAESNQYFITVSYGVTDWLSLDGKVGVGNLKHKPVGEDEVDYDTNFAGGYGFRTCVFQDQRRDLKAVFGFQHISVHPDNRKVNSRKNEIILDDWQLSTLVSKGFGSFIPYLGIKISDLDLIHKVDGERKRKKTEDNFGIVIGTDIRIKDKLRINLECRFIDETAVAGGFVSEF